LGENISKKNKPEIKNPKKYGIAIVKNLEKDIERY
jgi:hypothetical protein